MTTLLTHLLSIILIPDYSTWKVSLSYITYPISESSLDTFLIGVILLIWLHFWNRIKLRYEFLDSWHSLPGPIGVAIWFVLQCKVSVLPCTWCAEGSYLPLHGSEDLLTVALWYAYSGASHSYFGLCMHYYLCW